MFLLTIVLDKVYAQEKQFSVLAGFKALEMSFSYIAENELIYGIALSAVDSKLSQDIANFHDGGKTHDFKGEIVPAAFGLIGGKFDKVKVIGKIGAGYVDQKINNVPEKQKFYLAFGFAYSYEFDNGVAIIGSCDSVNAALLGVSFKM